MEHQVKLSSKLADQVITALFGYRSLLQQTEEDDPVLDMFRQGAIDDCTYLIEAMLVGRTKIK